MLAVVLLALGASLRSTRLQRDVALASADVRIARQAAEASMADAEHALRLAFQRLPVSENPLSSTERFTSLCAAPQASLSRYQMALLRSEGLLAVCQLTAQGSGRIATTSVRLQAEFELSDCPTPADAPPPDDASASSCHRAVQLLSWRALEGV